MAHGITNQNTMLNKGAYDDEHDAVHKETGARSSILIVLAGKNGHGLSCKCTEEDMKRLPEILGIVAKSIGPEVVADLKQIAEIKKGNKPNAESTTEDSGPQSFAG